MTRLAPPPPLPLPLPPPLPSAPRHGDPELDPQAAQFRDNRDEMLDLRDQVHRALLQRVGSLSECAAPDGVVLSCWFRFDVEVDAGLLQTRSISGLRCHEITADNQFVAASDVESQARYACVIDRIGRPAPVALVLPVDSPLLVYRGPLDINIVLRRAL